MAQTSGSGARPKTQTRAITKGHENPALLRLRVPSHPSTDLIPFRRSWLVKDGNRSDQQPVIDITQFIHNHHPTANILRIGDSTGRGPEQYDGRKRQEAALIIKFILELFDDNRRKGSVKAKDCQKGKNITS